MSVSDGGIGEASRAREDGDDERPLKKARFAWQVKGKHHLRREERSEPPAPQESDSDAEEAAGAFPPVVATVPRAQQSSGDERGSARPCTPCTVWEEHRDQQLEMWERELSHEDLPTLLSRRLNRREDYLLEMWQARQLAKCAVDNTINRVLDTWTSVARARADDAGSVADASDAPAHSIEVENEGILMAISAHGLTTPHSIHLHAPARVEQACHTHQDLEIVELCSPCYRPDEDPVVPYLDKLTSSIDVDTVLPTDGTNSQSPHSGIDFQQRGYESPQRGCEATKRDYESPERGCETTKRDYESPQRGCESPPTETEFPTTDQFDADEHFNFMDAAVAFAIQHKGLTSLASGNG